MKLATFIAGSAPRLGAVVDNQIVDLNMAYAAYLAAKGETLPYQSAEATIPSDLQLFLTKGDRALQAATDVLAHVAERQKAGAPLGGPDGEQVIYPLEGTTLKAPIQRPEKIIGIGLNYLDHCLEQNKQPPSSIITFGVFANAIIGPGETILIPKISSHADWEAEFVVVFGKQAKHVPPEQAFDYIAGYTCGNDVSIRDVQRTDPGMTRGKSGDTHAPIGPWIVTKDEIPDPDALDIELRLNGVVKQTSNTKHLIFKIPELVAFITRHFTMQPGDMIFTGTPGGVGVYRNPPEWMKPGDTVEITIEKIGTLTNNVGAEQ